jgi:Flp pilus assembly protein TadD
MRMTKRVLVVVAMAFSVAAIVGCTSTETKTQEADRQGKEAFDKGDFDLAISCYSELIHLDPKSAHAYYNRGVAYGRNNDHDKEIADYSQAIRLDPKLSLAYQNRAVAYGQKGEKAKAEADIAEAKRLRDSEE